MLSPFLADEAAQATVAAAKEMFPALIARQRFVRRSKEDVTMIIQEGNWEQWETIYDKALRFLTSGITALSAPELAGTDPGVFAEHIFTRFQLSCPAGVRPIMKFPYSPAYMATDPDEEWAPPLEAVGTAYETLIAERDLVPRTHVPVPVTGTLPNVPRLHFHGIGDGGDGTASREGDQGLSDGE